MSGTPKPSLAELDRQRYERLEAECRRAKKESARKRSEALCDRTKNKVQAP